MRRLAVSSTPESTPAYYIAPASRCLVAKLRIFHRSSIPRFRPSNGRQQAQGQGLAGGGLCRPDRRTVPFAASCPYDHPFGHGRQKDRGGIGGRCDAILAACRSYRKRAWRCFSVPIVPLPWNRLIMDAARRTGRHRNEVEERGRREQAVEVANAELAPYTTRRLRSMYGRYLTDLVGLPPCLSCGRIGCLIGFSGWSR